jgi:hypothetical protein
MTTSKTTVAVVDVGTARTKLTACSVDEQGEVTFSSAAIEADILGAWERGGIGECDRCIGGVIAEAKMWLIGVGAVAFCGVGTHLFRDQPYSAHILQKAVDGFGSFNVLSPELEAAVFYQSLLTEHGGEGVTAADVGGGSLQVIWGVTTEESFSVPFGTRSIEKSYQTTTTDALSPDGAEWKQAYNDVLAAITKRAPQADKPRKLIIGSNVMADFFATAMNESGVSDKPNAEFSNCDIKSLASFIGGKPYASTYNLFPQNPMFMHGADKLLLVTLALMDGLNVTSVVGTNSSVSKGLARLLVSAPAELEALGIQFKAQSTDSAS